MPSTAAAATEADYDSLCDEHAEWLSGWASTHDYDPTWDYTVCFEQREHPLYLLACEVMKQVCAEAATNDGIPFNNGRVYPAKLDGGAAVFIDGTSSEPVVLIDIAVHLEVLDEEFAGGGNLAMIRKEQVEVSVIHELRHAVQEAYGMPFCEDEAEYGSAAMPF